MALNRQVIKQKEEELKQRMESANQTKSKLKVRGLFLHQMRGKFHLSTKASNLRFKDHQLLTEESQS